jgi:group II intron reverse transcriptase/maturase
VQSKLEQITVKARQDRRLKFTSLAHLMNVQNLEKCYSELKRNKACGIDMMTLDEYGANLKERIEILVRKLKDKSYRSQPVRRVYIPKVGTNEMRGLGIPTVEDKLIQVMLKKILESIFEADFLDCSYGFRPNRNCHQAVNALDKTVMKEPSNYIVEVDIRKFFDNVQHDWLIRCLEERIIDPNILWIVNQVIKSGFIEDGQFKSSHQGTPQGGIISPLLANIYLHFVLDLWFEKKFKPQLEGHARLIRYCDDFVVSFENEADALIFMDSLQRRLEKFGLEVSPSKTRIIKFGKRAWQIAMIHGQKVASFNFLGFTHYCAKSRRGKFIMGHRTSKENLNRKLKEIKVWLKEVYCAQPLKDWWEILKVKIAGHFNYFGIRGNSRCTQQFYKQIVRLAYKWINRRSQKKSMNWEELGRYLQLNPLPKPRICYSLYT